MMYILHWYEGCVHELIPHSQLYTVLLYTLNVGIRISSTDRESLLYLVFYCPSLHHGELLFEFV